MQVDTSPPAVTTRESNPRLQRRSPRLSSPPPSGVAVKRCIVVKKIAPRKTTALPTVLSTSSSNENSRRSSSSKENSRRPSSSKENSRRSSSSSSKENSRRSSSASSKENHHLTKEKKPKISSPDPGQVPRRRKTAAVPPSPILASSPPPQPSHHPPQPSHHPHHHPPPPQSSHHPHPPPPPQPSPPPPQQKTTEPAAPPPLPPSPEDLQWSNKVRRSYSRLSDHHHRSPNNNNSTAHNPRETLFGFETLKTPEVFGKPQPRSRCGAESVLSDLGSFTSLIDAEEEEQQEGGGGALDLNIPGVVVQGGEKKRRRRRKAQKVDVEEIDSLAAQMNAEFEEAEGFTLFVE